MTERRRLPKRASLNLSFECADLKYSCTVKRFDGSGSADVWVWDAASHLQVCTFSTRADVARRA
jgi:hypothetical protein